MEVKGDDTFRVRAFTNAARAVERLSGDVGSLARGGELLAIKGVGKGTASILAEAGRGESPEVIRELERQIPEGVRRLLEVRGLGPKRVRSVWVDLGVETVGELEYACRENRLVGLPGFGAKTQEAVLENIRFLQRTHGRLLIHKAWAEAAQVEALILEAVSAEETLGETFDLEVTGELRRGCETVGRVSFIAVCRRPQAVRRMVSESLAPKVSRDGCLEGWTDDEVEWRLAICGREESAASMIAETGPEAHVDRIRDRARSLGLGWRHDGLYDGDDRCVLGDEEAVYRRLGCSWIPPEIRHDGGVLDRAAAGKLPELVGLEEFSGALHNHTTDSDGSGTLRDMAEAAAELGWRWLGIADHSQAAVYANGLSPDRLEDQGKRIDEWNAGGAGPFLLKGIEADILADGELDLSAGCEDGLDYVVASVHSSFRLDEEAQTKRILTAVADPRCRVLGHVTGRLLLARPAYEVDLERVLRECAERGVAVEINASPYRLDVDRRWARFALEVGARLAVNPDAHAPDGLADVRWGTAVARGAGAGPGDLLNCLDKDELLEWFSRQ